MALVINKITNESWVCVDVNDVTIIEGVEFIKVSKPHSPLNTVLMNKAATTILVTNEMAYSDKPLLNG